MVDPSLILLSYSVVFIKHHHTCLSKQVLCFIDLYRCPKGYSSGCLRKGRERKSFISFVCIFVLFVGLLFYEHLVKFYNEYCISHSFVDTALNFPFPYHNQENFQLVVIIEYFQTLPSLFFKLLCSFLVLLVVGFLRQDFKILTLRYLLSM